MFYFLIFKKNRENFFCTKIFFFFNFFFEKIIIELFYVNVIILHFDLNNFKRVILIKRFNNFEKFLIIFIIIHFINTQNVNFDKYCYRIFVIINVRNAFQKW